MKKEMGNRNQMEQETIEDIQDFLRIRLKNIVETLSDTFQKDIKIALEAESKLWSRQSERKIVKREPDQTGQPVAGSWPLSVFLIAVSIQKNISLEVVGGVALSVEFLICALDILDDVEDGDVSELIQKIGVPRSLNVSTILLVLAQRCLLNLYMQAGYTTTVPVLLTAYQQALERACSGQHQDLLNESRSVEEVTQQEYLEVASAKAGALMSLAFRLGALCAEADEGMTEDFARLGELLGIAHQLDNDSHDLEQLMHSSSNGSRPGKSDLTRHKKNLPYLLAYRYSAEEWDGSGPIEQPLAWRAGVLGTWGTGQLYREEARAVLQKISSKVLLRNELLEILRIDN